VHHFSNFLKGVPMLAVLGTSSADATYFGRIFLIEIFAVSCIAVVVGPKIIRAIRIRRNPELGRKKGRVNVSGIYQPTSSQDTNQSMHLSSIASYRHPAPKFSAGTSFNGSGPLPHMQQPLVHVHSETEEKQDEEHAQLSL